LFDLAKAGGCGQYGSFVNKSNVVIGWVGRKTMLKLIEIELTRIRRMLEKADEIFLQYLIDMAIIEANAKARASNDSLESLVEHEGPRKALRVVR